MLSNSASTREMIIHGERYYHPGISVDCVIFGFHDGVLKVLLNKFAKLSSWRLPGGFVKKEEDLDVAAYRVLQARTGLDNIYLRQFHTFGNVNRSNKDELEGLSELFKFSFSSDTWLMQRFVSVGYFALVDASLVKIFTNEEFVGWFDLKELPEISLDHKEIIEKALEFIRIQLDNIPLAEQLLPEKFTLPELQRIYETILNERLDRRNFRRKILSLDILEKLNEKRSDGGAHKSPDLYVLRNSLKANSPMLLR